MLIAQGVEDMTHRCARASAAWTRAKQARLFNLHAYDVGQDDRGTQNGALFDYAQNVLAKIGAAPWIMGADFSQQPGEPLPNWRRKANAFAPQTPTHVHGKILEWFLASPLLGVACIATAVPDAATVGHTPVKFAVPAYQHLDLGNTHTQTACSLPP